MAELNEKSKSIIKSTLIMEENILKLGLSKWENKLRNFEKEQGMSTEEFVDKFNSGELGDDDKWFNWMLASKAYNHLKDRLQDIKNIKL